MGQLRPGEFIAQEDAEIELLLRQLLGQLVDILLDDHLALEPGLGLDQASHILERLLGRRFRQLVQHGAAETDTQRRRIGCLAPQAGTGDGQKSHQHRRNRDNGRQPAPAGERYKKPHPMVSFSEKGSGPGDWAALVSSHRSN